ncbi:MAG: high frequency lysogenization protein HflD [Woeseiaceae bacterium]
MNNFQQRVIALSGVFQAAKLVTILANKGTLADNELSICVTSIFETSPDNVNQVFGGTHNLSIGFETLCNQLGKDSKSRDIEIARYVVSMLFLERRLIKNSEMLETLSSGIELATRQSEHFSITHENVISNIADLYSRTISQLGPRIMVNGDQALLENTAISNKIRTILLSGIRSAVLWQQLGGRRWHIFFQRGQYLKTTRYYLENE